MRGRAKRVQAAVDAHGVTLSDLGYFDNMLHEDALVRGKKHAFMRRVFEAASLLGVPAVCGFVGRNQAHSMDQNLIDFEQQFIPLLKEAKDRGLTFRVEQCPMPGWTTATTSTTTSRTRLARGLPCTGFASGMAWAISSGFTTTRHMRC
jgi:sugar phosphate isomerase/epimerase